MIRRSPCKGCEGRTPGCHSKCERFVEWRAVYDHEREKIRKHEDSERVLDEMELLRRRQRAIRRKKK